MSPRLRKLAFPFSLLMLVVTVAPSFALADEAKSEEGKKSRFDSKGNPKWLGDVLQGNFDTDPAEDEPTVEVQKSENDKAAPAEDAPSEPSQPTRPALPGPVEKARIARDQKFKDAQEAQALLDRQGAQLNAFWNAYKRAGKKPSDKDLVTIEGHGKITYAEALKVRAESKANAQYEKEAVARLDDMVNKAFKKATQQDTAAQAPTSVASADPESNPRKTLPSWGDLAWKYADLGAKYRKSAKPTDASAVAIASAQNPAAAAAVEVATAPKAPSAGQKSAGEKTTAARTADNKPGPYPGKPVGDIPEPETGSGSLVRHEQASASNSKPGSTQTVVANTRTGVAGYSVQGAVKAAEELSRANAPTAGAGTQETRAASTAAASAPSSAQPIGKASGAQPAKEAPAAVETTEAEPAKLAAQRASSNVSSKSNSSGGRGKAALAELDRVLKDRINYKAEKSSVYEDRLKHAIGGVVTLGKAQRKYLNQHSRQDLVEDAVSRGGSMPATRALESATILSIQDLKTRIRDYTQDEAASAFTRRLQDLEAKILEARKLRDQYGHPDACSLDNATGSLSNLAQGLASQNWRQVEGTNHENIRQDLMAIKASKDAALKHHSDQIWKNNVDETATRSLKEILRTSYDATIALTEAYLSERTQTVESFAQAVTKNPCAKEGAGLAQNSAKPDLADGHVFTLEELEGGSANTATLTTK